MKHILVYLLVFVMIPAFAGDVPKYTSKPVKTPKTVKTTSGLEYTITAKGNGPVPKAGDKVMVHYTGTLVNGTKFDSSVDKGTPFGFKLGKGEVIKGWDEAFALLHGGDKAKLVIPAELGYGNHPNGQIPANSILNFEVELVGIIPAPTPWAVAKGMDTVTTSSGLKYILFKENKANPKPTKDQVVHMHYSGFLAADGKMFDSSVEKGKPLPFPLGRKMVIPGWEEIAALMHKGDKIKIIVPPQLGYGDAGFSRLVPPKATLVFDMELVDIITIVPYVIADSLNNVVTPGGTIVYKIKSGEGTASVGGTEPVVNPPACTPGKRVHVIYTGYLTDGTIFDSSVFRDQPYGVTLGKRSVIPGWEEALLTTRQGDKIRIVVPYQQAYGEAGRAPVIPPKATLIFDMEVVHVQ